MLFSISFHYVGCSQFGQTFFKNLINAVSFAKLIIMKLQQRHVAWTMNDTSSVIVDLFTKVKHGMSNNCHVALHEHCHYELARRDYIDSFLKKGGTN